jgi:predicted enzyme related to lactoylglutathione lyase
MTVATPVLTQIGQIAVTTRDTERAVRFYRDVLGLPFLFQAGPLAFFMCGSVRLMLSTPEKPEFDHPASILYYRVEDIAAAHETLVSRGVTFIEAPRVIHKAPDHDLWMAFFHDSEGNPLALMSERPRA